VADLGARRSSSSLSFETRSGSPDDGWDVGPDDTFHEPSLPIRGTIEGVGTHHVQIPIGVAGGAAGGPSPGGTKKQPIRRGRGKSAKPKSAKPKPVPPPPVLQADRLKKQLEQLPHLQLRRLNSSSSPGLANEVIAKIFPHKKVFRARLKGNKKRIYSDDLDVKESVELALAIIKKHPHLKDHYIK
jgi:hypothetical protein